MLSLHELVSLAEENSAAMELPVASFRIADREFATDNERVLMGVVNLSRDSTYRESIAPTRADAVRRARIMVAQGAQVIDIGAESSRSSASRTTAQAQIDSLVPVIEELTAIGIPTSVESYEIDVIRAGLAAGASVVNLTGTRNEGAVYEAVAEHGASMVMCFTPGETVRDELELRIPEDPIPTLLEHFAPRIELARSAGVASIAVDPGLGFFYKSVLDPQAKIRYQLRTLLRSFGLRALGVPVCALTPQAIEAFQEEAAIGEAITSVFATLGGVGILRIHEVSQVAATLRLLGTVGSVGIAADR